uniref:NADH dehydrogenase subunit 2 n=1 Tax=Aelurostrongylus abstrusus TaxID=321389 RepID=K7QGQ7_AELAB|nr:NADH dehydrogenase subunit 2 [Aelurostrongylus abstrusus]AFT65556.1 NADH dehydrogenase subunit 2 [Aelurostrongylus abstrusus]
MFFCFFLVFLLSLFVTLVNNIFFWWGVFLLMTIFIVVMNKQVFSYSSIFNYFILQESLGLLFLLLFLGYLPLLILMLKLGVSPFHFWIFKVVNGMSGFNLVWFLTVHKIPFVMVFQQLFLDWVVYFLLVGLFLCLFQMFVVKSFKSLLVVSSVDSLGWVMLGMFMSFFNSFFCFFYYVFFMVLLISKFDLLSGISKNFDWELVLVFMNVPFSVSFFIKVFLLMEFLVGFGYFVLFLLFFMFLSILSIVFWLILLSVKDLSFEKYSVPFVFFMLPLMIVVMFFYL